MLLVLQHVVTWYSHIEASVGSKDAGKHLFQPSTNKERGSASTARGKASMFCPELLFDHALVLNNKTIEKISTIMQSGSSLAIHYSKWKSYP